MDAVAMTDATSGFDQGCADLIEENSLRANTYSILAGLLSDIPSSDLLDYLRHIAEPENDNKDSGEIGAAWQQLKAAAQRVDADDLDAEYHALFIGLGRGEVVPYGSWHITGFLMEKPLSDLRDDLESLGIEADENVKDPEDHIAALCETMALIIEATDVDAPRVRQFYARHIHPWAAKFFKELESAGSSDFYKSVGLLGQRFIDLENQYLNIQSH